MELSKRLQAVADMVTPGFPLADIGTDHGYVPIYLVTQGICPSAVAMDIRKGPLQKAVENISAYGLSGKIVTRLSDGVKQLRQGEAKSIVAAGMGGGLVIKIMQEAGEAAQSAEEWVLQPQSELWKVRKYLLENGWRIVDENMVFEEGKYYPMMKVRKGQTEAYSQMELLYGKLLLQKKHPVLRQYLERELRIKSGILAELASLESESAGDRRRKLEEEIQILTDAVNVFERGR